MITFTLYKTGQYTDKHHLMGSMSANKKTGRRADCEKFNLYIYCTHDDHMNEFEKHKSYYCEQVLKVFDLDFWEIQMLIRKSENCRTTKEQTYLYTTAFYLGQQREHQKIHEVKQWDNQV